MTRNENRAKAKVDDTFHQRVRSIPLRARNYASLPEQMHEQELDEEHCTIYTIGNNFSTPHALNPYSQEILLFYPNVWLDPWSSSCGCGLWGTEEWVGAVNLEKRGQVTHSTRLNTKTLMAWNTSEVTLFRAELELLPKNGYTSCTKGGH